MMRMRCGIPSVILPALLGLAAGCSVLRIEPDDNLAIKSGKFAGRMILATVTGGVSEQTYTVWRRSAAMDRMMSSWVGQPVGELLMAWGRPSDVVPDGSGGGLIVYTENRTMTTPGSSATTTQAEVHAYDYGFGAHATGSETSRTVYTPAVTRNWQVVRRFRVNSDGIITSWSWHGL